MTTEDDFHRHLDEHPDDHHARLVFADFLQEQGDPRAEGYRALGAMGKRPFIGGRDNILPGSGGWTHDNNRVMEDYHRLPKEWWRVVPSVDESNLNYFRYQPNRREAEDAAALAFAKLPHERRAELLGQQSEKMSRRTYSRRTGRRYGRTA